MEYELTDSGPCRKTLCIKFTVQDIDAAFAESYGEINGHVQIKGFRKGKAPLRTLEKRFAAEAAAGAKEALIEKHVPDVIKAKNLSVIGNIVNKNPNDAPVPAAPFTLNILLEVAPDIEAPEYKGLELAAKPVEVSEASVDAELDKYRTMLAAYDKVDGPAEEGDVLGVDFTARVEGREIMNQSDKRLRVEGDVLFGLPCPDLKEKFVGARAGDRIELAITLPPDHPEPDLRSKPAAIEVAVKEVERGTPPELTDAFAEGLGMNSLAAFRERVKGNLIREAVLESRNKQEEEIIEKLISRVAFEIPADMITPEADALMEQRAGRLGRAGVQPGEIQAQIETFRPEAMKLAERKIRWGIVAGKIGEKEGITVTNEDLNGQIEALAASYRTTPAKIIQRIRQFNGIGPMATEIMSLKVVQLIIDHAKGGKFDPDRKDGEETEKVNADAAMSVALTAAPENPEGRDEGQSGPETAGSGA